MRNRRDGRLLVGRRVARPRALAIEASVGANEDWQNLIVRIVPDVLDRTMFVGSQAPTVDPTGTLLFETAAGAHGTLVLTVLSVSSASMIETSAVSSPLF